MGPQNSNPAIYDRGDSGQRERMRSTVSLRDGCPDYLVSVAWMPNTSDVAAKMRVAARS